MKEDDRELEFDVRSEEYSADSGKFVRDLEVELRKAFEVNTEYKLEEFGSIGSGVLYRLVGKDPDSLFVPIEVYLNPESKLLSLRYEFSLGLGDVNGSSVKEIAAFFRDYAETIENKERTILDLGFLLKDVHIDGIHHLHFYYQKDYPSSRVKVLVEDAKRLPK